MPPGSITNNFGVDPNYRLGYVQIWNVDVQQQIRPTLIMNLDYTGTKGTRLDILEAPNRTATGVLFPGVQPFYWEDSVGDSTANALSVRVRKRLQAGLFDWRPLHVFEVAGQRLHHRKRRAAGGAGRADAPEFPASPTSPRMPSTFPPSAACPASISAQFHG